ncbi:MAG: histidine--tRNA ligase [Candidatus Aenigmatarchaeota archaeon]
MLIPKGFKDFEPKAQIIRNKIFSRVKDIFESFGYEPLETPIVEYWNTLKGKYGEEAESKLIWRFKLPYSETEYALRYDLTVPLARFVASKKPKLPFKRYQIGAVFRYEEPQKGRYRQFYQADFDIIGSKYPEADAEILNVAEKVFSSFNLDFEIVVNHRSIIEGILESLNLKEKFLEICRAIDKLDKIGIEGIKKELKKLEIEEEKVNKIIEIISSSETIKNEKFENGLKNLNEILEFVESKNIRIDFSLVRGLDYYTGMVFEVKIKNLKIGSVGAGGRYDDLIGIFSKQNIPAVGGSIGIDRLVDAIISLNLIKERESVIDIAVIYTNFEVYKEAWKIANKLRNVCNVYIDISRKSFREQINWVVSKNIRYLIIVGKEDLKNYEVTFQDREKREIKKVKLNEIENFIKNEIENRGN